MTFECGVVVAGYIVLTIILVFAMVVGVTQCRP